jgi:hypothetical protein
VLSHLTESLWLSVSDWLAHPPPEIDSLIISEFVALFEAFRAKRFKLLWRGSGDGFTASEFHRRCNGCANTLTLIVDTDGNVFGGFTPVKWESSVAGEWEMVWNMIPALERQRRPATPFNKDANSLGSFLFTLRNSHGVSPRKFALKAEKKQWAINCFSDLGPVFYGCIGVYDNCNANRDSHTRFGTRWSNCTYANDTAFNDFLTGAHNFTVKEIEVFEIAD